jgi:hypothetical protein
VRAHGVVGPVSDKRGQGAERTADDYLRLTPVSYGMRHDPTNLDHVAYTIVGLGILGWIVSLLLR